MLTAARWFLLWLLLVLAICLAGAVVGVVLYPVAGSLLSMELPVSTMAINGLKDGAFLAFIWAPGIGIVACMMLAWSRRAKPEITGPNALDRQNKEI